MMKIFSLVATASVIVVGLSENALASVSDRVEIYGVIAASMDRIDNGDDRYLANQGGGNLKLSSNASRIGFRGKEDLGDGLGAIWQIESLIYIDGSASSTFATRNSFVGWRNGWGTLLLGRYDTPYKRATRIFDVFSLQLADNRSLLGGVAGTSAKKAFDGRETDMLVYQSPERRGFSAEAAYAMGAEIASAATQQKGGTGHWQFGFAAITGTSPWRPNDIGSATPVPVCSQATPAGLSPQAAAAKRLGKQG